MQAKLWKAAREAEHRNPGWARLLSRTQRPGLPLERVLHGIVVDSECELKLRSLAARMLHDVGGATSAFVPLLSELIAAGDVRNRELCSVIQAMNHGRIHLAGPAFAVLHSTLRNGTPEQRYWVVNEIAFFTSHRDRYKVRHALIEVLDDASAPAEARGWAAERLHLHTSQETLRACLRAIDDPAPLVRLWATYTVGVVAQFHPVFREPVIAALERKLTDEGVGPGWWSVCREAQSWLVSLHGGSDEEDRLQAEVRVVLSDPAASVEDKGWASFNDRS
jgi:hypothetical protein